MSLVSMQHIRKTFSGVVALGDINFDVRPGEVHALLGENGAGKSTLMKILSGVYQPTSGQIIIDGQAHEGLTPRDSMDAGIRIIYQELSVIDQLTIAENIFVGQLLRKQLGGVSVVDWAAMKQRTTELLASVGLRHDPMTLVRALSISEKQMVEIIKAVAFDARVLVMDEPTSSLTEEEVGQLFTIVRRLREAGTSVIYISHKLKEITELADRVTVLKDGVAMWTKNVDEVTIDSMVTAMVGRELKDKFLAAPTSHHGEREVILQVDNLSRRDRLVQDVSFTVHKGEIVAFCGLVGAGRSELMTAIYGAAKRSQGTITLKGRQIDPRTPFDGIKAGLALVTEDRRGSGIFQNFSISDNASIGRSVKTSRLGGLWGLLDGKADRALAEEERVKLQVKCRDIDQNIVELSGGNQQKVLLSRWLATTPDLIIFDEPTKGIDVGTKAEIYNLMRTLADEGIGVILVSSELPEVPAVGDRILVFAEGRITAEFDAADATEEKLVHAAAFTAA